MSKLRYEQTQDTSHISHSHDGLSGVRLQYDVDLHSQPRTLDNARAAKVRIMGKQGNIDYLEHGCGLTPIVKCYVGGKEVKIRVNIDRTTGFVTWSSEQEFTRADEAYLVIYGLATEYVIDDDAPEIDLTEYWCGYEWNVNDSDPSVKRITGKGLEDFFLREGGGILKGKLFKYVAVNPSTKEEVEVPIDDAEAYENYRYGQYGDLFAKMRGQLYYKVEKEGDIRRKKLSRYQLPGFRPYHSKDYIVYIGLYEASCNNERTKIYSRVTPESEYATHVGGDKNSNYTEKLFNMPATDMNTQTFSNLAHSKGEGYDIMDYMTWLMFSDLFMAEFGTRDSQATIQSADSNGYSCGGLGNGCTNISNWEAYNNGLNPVAELGCTDGLGSGYGQSLIPACSNGVEPSNAVYANRFYGIENPFGHIFKILTGLHVITKAGEGQTYESRNMYICDNPEKFMITENRDNGTDDVNIQFEAGYGFEGNAPIGNGYIKDVVMGTYGSMLASENGASTSTYFCDYNYTTQTISSSSRWSVFGGQPGDSSRGGFFYQYSHGSWSNSRSTSCGTRLCLYKQPYEETYFFCEDCSGEDNTIIIKKNASEAPNVHVEYSYDTINWKELKTPTTEGSEIYLPANKKVYLRGNNQKWATRNADNKPVGNCILANNNYNVGGNITSLLLGEDFTVDMVMTTSNNHCFENLFILPVNYSVSGCYNDQLISSEKLIFPNTTTYACYTNMFWGCKYMIYSPKVLPAKDVAPIAYEQMFADCWTLKTTPIFMGKNINRFSYSYIFSTCLNIQNAELHAVNYNGTMTTVGMFSYCRNLSEIKCYFQHYDNSNNQFKNWLQNVSPTGTFWLPYDSVFADDAPRNASGIPAGWSIKYFDPETGLERERVTEEELKETYFYCEDISGEADNEVVIHKTGTSAVYIKLDLEYSYDQENWIVLDTPDVDEVYDVNIPFNGHRRVYLRGENGSFGSDDTTRIKVSNLFTIGGNIASLHYKDNFINQTTIKTACSFYNLFALNNNLLYSHNLFIPYNVANKIMYHTMFYQCSYLITPPKKIPNITNIATVKDRLFNGTFIECQNLLKSPEIQLTDFSCNIDDKPHTFRTMFYNCSKLKTIKVHFKTIYIDPSIAYGGGNHPFYRFCEGVASTGDFWMPYDATWNPEEYRGIIVPQNWTIRYFNTITGDEVFPESTLVE